MKHLRFLSVFGLLVALTACSSTDDKERQLEEIASHRATVLSNNLPIEHGPLTIMQAKSTGHVVELMMLFNESGTISPQALMAKSVESYCQSEDVLSVLEHGIVYNIKLRSARGQLLVDQTISENTCRDLAQK